MRIGIFTQCYWPTQNGVVVSIETFRKELERRGHEFFIFAPGYRNFRDQNPAHVFRFPSMPSTQKEYPLALPFLAPLQTAHIRDLRLDIIHTQHPFSMGKLGLKVGRRLDIPVVYTYHTLITEYAHYIPLFSGLAQKVAIDLSRSYCNATDQVVTPSSSMKELLRRYGVAVPIEVIPTGVTLADFGNPFHPERLRIKWQLPEDKKLLLYVSRIAKEKNLDFLFQAISRLSQRRQDFHLLMVGGGPELEHYRGFVRNSDLSCLVTFTGQQEKTETNRFFGAADIFVFPSITETQGIVITEAMAAGVPAVAINKMGPSDIIQDGVDGYLTPLKVEEFCERIEKLLDDEGLRKKMGTKAKQNAERFSTENMASAMEKLYERTISNYSQSQAI